MVFASRMSCRKCGEPKPLELQTDFQKGITTGRGEGGSRKQSSSGVQARAGDWNCPKCNEMVFASRMSCRKCGEPKPLELQTDFQKGINTARGGGGQRRYNVPERAGDWHCPTCGDLVFASRMSCRECGTQKPLELQSEFQKGGNRA